MQDDKKPLPPSHDQMNRPGMTNGVPDGAQEETPAASPSHDRHRSEQAAGNTGADKEP